jgi:hypothetical protein
MYRVAFRKDGTSIYIVYLIRFEKTLNTHILAIRKHTKELSNISNNTPHPVSPCNFIVDYNT